MTTPEEAISRLNGAQIAWARFWEVHDLVHHPALRRVRRFDCPTGPRSESPFRRLRGAITEMPIASKMGRH